MQAVIGPCLRFDSGIARPMPMPAAGARWQPGGSNEGRTNRLGARQCALMVQARAAQTHGGAPGPGAVGLALGARTTASHGRGDKFTSRRAAEDRTCRSSLVALFVLESVPWT